MARSALNGIEEADTRRAGIGAYETRLPPHFGLNTHPEAVWLASAKLIDNSEQMIQRQSE